MIRVKALWVESDGHYSTQIVRIGQRSHKPAQNSLIRRQNTEHPFIPLGEPHLHWHLFLLLHLHDPSLDQHPLLLFFSAICGCLRPESA